MECDKNEFLSVIDPWRGKRCVVTLTSELVNCRLIMRLDTLSTDGTLIFKGEPHEEFELDLSTADSFEWGDARSAPEAVRETADFLIEAAVSARISGVLLAGVILLRER